MYALTLRHPWAFAVQRLGKDVENRTWKPPGKLIGQTIAIHGGALPKGERLQECADDAQYITHEILTANYLRSLAEPLKVWLWAYKDEGFRLKDWIIPGIVATARLAEVVAYRDSPWFSGPYGWVLEDVTPIHPPVPHRGAQGLWEVEPTALALIKDAYAQTHNGTLP